MPLLRAFAAVLVLVLPWWPAPAGASPRDHDAARAAVAAGEVMPLPKLLQQLQRSHPGEVLEVELERQHGQWVYELRLLQADGRLLKLHVDARTGVPVDRRGRDERDRRER